MKPSPRPTRQKYWKTKAVDLLLVRYRGKPCEVCGSPDRTVGHHVLPQALTPVHALTGANITVLCPSHHYFSPDRAPHSRNPMAVLRWWRWLEANRPDQFRWALEHEHDRPEGGVVRWEDAYRRLATEAGITAPERPRKKSSL